ncbi:unnamed protein product [Rhizopus microsporus]
MATPRQPSNEEVATPSTPRTPKSSGAVFAKPHALRKKIFQKKVNKNENEETETTLNAYRDRAAERRQQELAEDDSQLTTEELLKRTQREADEELNAQQLYEQSKYLGGDIDHTHLVKGLDFALLNKVRRDLSKEEKQHPKENDIVAEQPTTTNVEEPLPVDVMDGKPKFHSVMAKNIYDLIMKESRETKKQRVDLFEPGRMSFVFELADEVGYYSDAFAVPTAVIRSKADMDTNGPADVFAEMNLVVEKISQVMTSIRHGEDRKKPMVNTNRPIHATLTAEPVAMSEDGFSGDIFADVGRDYQLDESTIEASKKRQDIETETTNKESYFKGLAVDDEEEDEAMPDAKETVASILSQAKEENTQPEQSQKRRKLDNVDRDIMDMDAADIDMFGLGSSALPTSFDERSKVTAYQSDDEESKTHLVDHGTNRNKKAQLTRWDFDTDEEWQKYKDSIEILPKSAVQFGVKLNDGRKKGKEKKGLNDKQRFDRDFQQVKNILSQKYGKSLE